MFYYLEDIVRNEFSLLNQEVKKEKWRVFRKTMDYVSFFDKQYDALGDFKFLRDWVNKFMTYFVPIMEVLNDKKSILINNNLD